MWVGYEYGQERNIIPQLRVGEICLNKRAGVDFQGSLLIHFFEKYFIEIFKGNWIEIQLLTQNKWQKVAT